MAARSFEPAKRWQGPSPSARRPPADGGPRFGEDLDGGGEARGGRHRSGPGENAQSEDDPHDDEDSDADAVEDAAPSARTFWSVWTKA